MTFFDFFKREKSCRLLTHLDGPLIEKYRYFREFLGLNRDALNLMAELEQTHYRGSLFNEKAVRVKIQELLETTGRLTETLNNASKQKYGQLTVACGGITREIQSVFTATPSTENEKLVLSFDDLTAEMISVAGSKATNLAIIGNTLGLKVPQGFVVTAHAFRSFLEKSGLASFIATRLEQVEVDSLTDLESASEEIRSLINRTALPEFLVEAIQGAYSALETKTRPGVRIAMRSSAVGEDTEASFAGQYITELNVTRANLLDAYKAVVASKYSPRAILYRLQFGFADEDTPMCVAGVEMVDAVASGVLYTIDPARPASGEMKISAILGLGEHLVSGESSPDDYFVDRDSFQTLRREIRQKNSRLVASAEDGVHLEEIPLKEGLVSSIDEATVSILAQYGKTLEEYFQGPQDVEWAVDTLHQLYLLQARPLAVVKDDGEDAGLAAEFAKYTVRLQGGRAACPGVVAGKVYLAEAGNLAAIAEGSILVARTASPDYAEFVGRVGGIITDVGSVASHLASVAREFRVPALFDTQNATHILQNGEAITLVSQQSTVYEGIVEGLSERFKVEGRLVVNSPTHKRLRAVLDLVSPLNLTDPSAADFSPEGCRTLHDIIRFAHERIMKEIFFLSEKTDGALSVRLQANIPLVLYCIDLGGGLQERLTTCDDVTSNHLTSIPMKALWRGFMHPGISWAGTINLSTNNLLTHLSSTAVSEFGATPGGDSYAVISRDYMNLSAKFGYHYANVDAFCAEEEENADQNHILLQFSGGGGSLTGRSLRLQFLASVLGRLSFHLTITGDLLEASLKGIGQKDMEETLDQLGRLLASSRLLDMAITDPAQAEEMTDAFFQGEYDFLNQNVGNRLPGFYTPSGDWRSLEDHEEGMVLIQDGSRWLTTIGTSFAGFMGKVAGQKYQEFLDNVGAYYHFPLAIAKESSVGDAAISVQVQPMGGRIDQAGGLAFGLRNVGNYFVLRINALEYSLILFEFVNNRRYERANASVEIETGQCYTLRVEVTDRQLKGYLDGKLLMEYTADWPVQGHVGLWTKADSVTRFCNLTVNEISGTRKLSDTK
ncbi:MAG: hypothetical protein JZU65_13955 [Chlorobium sp.]|nr:hypothetical protein [Chlorobium sp.]